MLKLQKIFTLLNINAMSFDQFFYYHLLFTDKISKLFRICVYKLANKIGVLHQLGFLANLLDNVSSETLSMHIRLNYQAKEAGTFSLICRNIV